MNVGTNIFKDSFSNEWREDDHQIHSKSQQEKSGQKDLIVDSKNNISNDKLNSSVRRKIKQKKQYNKSKYYLSIKYAIFLTIIWLIFLASFIVGFIVRYDIQSAVTASSVIWTFSSIIFVICIIYTYLYYKAKSVTGSDNLRDYLKYFPL